MGEPTGAGTGTGGGDRPPGDGAGGHVGGEPRPGRGAPPTAHDGPVGVWFHCHTGIAGDMALGALIDAGADIDAVGEVLDGLPVGFELRVEPVLRAGLAATRVVVEADDTVVRTYAHIEGLLAEARLPDRVRRRAGAVFAALAEAEARLHRRPVAQVHFHEVGAVDAIVDVVGVAAALEDLGVEVVTSSPVATGHGMHRSAHGLLPTPAPAVVELLAGAPVVGVDVPHQLTTPTGAAILRALVSRWGPMPPMVVTSSGRGAGARDLEDRPNVTGVVVGRLREPVGVTTTHLSLVETTVDDVTGEVLAETLSAALGAGALDGWIVPVTMKKGRPGHILAVLCEPDAAGGLAELVGERTGSLGVRVSGVERRSVPRTTVTVEVAGHPVRVKVGPARVKAERDDVAAVSAATGLTHWEVAATAEQAARLRTAAPHPVAPSPPGGPPEPEPA